MDLFSLKVSGSSKLIIKHPATGADTDCVIELCGKDSTQFRDAYGELIKSVVGKDHDQIDFAAIDAKAYAACTVSWENLEENGKAIECTPENILNIYTNPDYKWLHEQVVQFVGSRENFMQPS